MIVWSLESDQLGSKPVSTTWTNNSVSLYCNCRAYNMGSIVVLTHRDVVGIILNNFPKAHCLIPKLHLIHGTYYSHYCYFYYYDYSCYYHCTSIREDVSPHQHNFSEVEWNVFWLCDSMPLPLCAQILEKSTNISIFTSPSGQTYRR